MNLPRVSIFGVSVSKLNLQETARFLTEAVESKRPHQVITVNPIIIMTALKDPEYMGIMQRAELIIPDGTGVVWAANYVGNPVSERVPGIELLHELLTIGQTREWKVFLLGASPETIQIAARKLQETYPQIKFVGIRDGYFSYEQDAEVIRQISEAQPDLLFVGRSASTQEPWIDQYKQQLNVPVMMGVGGSFDVISGKLKRAPIFFQKLRLEWFYRLLQEPYRYKRMLELPRFVAKVVREKANVQK